MELASELFRQEIKGSGQVATTGDLGACRMEVGA